MAELDVRTTVEADSDYLLPLLRKHIENQGYHLVDGEPSDDNRARYSKLARMKVGLPAKGVRQPIDSAIGRWVQASLDEAYAGSAGMKTVRIRVMGGTVPTHEIVTPLHAPFVLVPVVNSDNNQHAFDENLRMGNYVTGMRTMCGLLLTPLQE